MLTYAILVFVIAALGGLVMATRVLRGQFAPWPLSLLHAALGAIGLVMLLYLAATGTGGVILPLVVLVAAALGGFYLAFLHTRKTVAPRPVVLVHAGVAVVGVAILLVRAFI